MANEQWYWLASGLGWGAVNSGALLAACPGGPQEVYARLGSAMLDDLLTQKQAEKLAATRPEDFALPLAACGADGIAVIGYDDPRYPAALRTIHNPPLVLFVRGDTTLLNGQLSIGIVGARRPSAYGVEAVKALGRGIAMGGAIIVSGLAAGLDTEAHKAALAVNGPTIACIAFGHDHCYPAANRKLMEVIEHHGAVVSEYPPDTGPEKPYFLQRNRLIAGLSHGLVVAEARKQSGTMSTVNFAADFGRDVFAVPGSIFSELSGGTNAMIHEGAYLAASATDILAVYGIELPGEDPVAEAARQAAEGRPAAAPAQAAPAWQQNLNRFETARTEPGREGALPGQQTLQQAQKQVSKSAAAGPAAVVSTTQAIEGYRPTQRKGLPESDSGIDARVAAVADSVELGNRGSRGASGEKTSGIQPFPWHRVEHLDKDEIEDFSGRIEPPAVRPGRRRASLGSRVLEAEKSMPKTTGPQKANPAGQTQQAFVPPTPKVTTAPTPPVSSNPVSRVERVGGSGTVVPVSPMERIQEIQALRESAEVFAAEAAGERAASAQSARAQPAQAPAAQTPKPEPKPRQKPEPKRDTFIPTPAADRPGNDLQPDLGLADRLKTLQKKQEATRTKNRPAAGFTAPASAGRKAAPAAQLSDVAKRALKQLGPKPADLAEIRKRSGLSSAEAMAALTELELAGLSRQLAGRQFMLADT